MAQPKFALIDSLTAKFKSVNTSTLKGAGDDAAVISCGNGTCKLVATDLLLEGIHFSLVYDPLKHLGYRLVTAGVSNIAAMNGRAEQILVSIGVSARFSEENLGELFDGIRTACETYNTDLAGVDISTSMTGITLGITVAGTAAETDIVYRSGAQPGNLICVSGNLGAAYMGLLLLERERMVFENNPAARPKLDGYDYIIKRRLKPEARTDIPDMLREAGVAATSMTDITDGPASEMLHICKQSGTGARIYLDKIPIASETFKICDEMNFDAVTAALNGGGDYEMLFTVPIADYDKIKGSVNVIGHITEPSKGCCLVTPDGEEIELKAPGFGE